VLHDPTRFLPVCFCDVSGVQLTSNSLGLLCFVNEKEYKKLIFPERCVRAGSKSGEKINHEEYTSIYTGVHSAALPEGGRYLARPSRKINSSFPLLME
jgi:hypothetical protein